MAEQFSGNRGRPGNFRRAGGECGNDDKGIVVVLHGLGRSRAAMWVLARRFEQAGFRVENFGYQSMLETPPACPSELRSRIVTCCASTSHKVHFVGHSLGGLIIRAYLAQHPMPNLGRVVLLGTPNQGTELVDRYRDEWWFNVLGLTAKELGTQASDLPKSLPKPAYAIGVIAGMRQSDANEQLLPGEDDGLVTAASTKLAGMSDFIVMPASHFTCGTTAMLQSRPSVSSRQGVSNAPHNR